MILSHRIQLRPRKRHIQAFTKACGCARYTWNWALEQWNKTYTETGKNPNSNNLKKQWNKQKPSWVYESPKDANQQPFQNLAKAWKNFFQGRAKKPRFKKKNTCDSFYVSNDKIRLAENAIRLPVIGWVAMTEKLRFEGKIKSATVSREADRWFVSIQVETEIKPKHGTETIGIDLGVKDAVVLSSRTKLEGPKPLKKHLKRLRKRQRKHSKKKKGSKNRKKSAIKLAKLHYKIKNIRKDFLNKTTSMLVSRAKTLVIEDLNIQGMLANHKLARAISDIGFYEFRRQLVYKCAIHEVQLIIANRFFPSTKLCNKCGTKNKEITLADRLFKCECGYIEDRDVNAAFNLRTLGFGETNACGEKGSDLVFNGINPCLSETGTKC